MINKTITKLPKSQVEVAITVPWTDLEPKWNDTLTKLAAELELPGFRKGQVPLNMAEQNLGNKLADEVLRAYMPNFLIDALQGTDVVPIDYPKYQLLSFTKGGQLQFKAVVTERPKVTLGNYKSISVTRPALKPVTDEDVNKLVDELFKRWKARNSLPQTQSSAAGNSGIVNVQGNPVSSQSIDQPNDDFAKAVGAASLTDLKIKIRADLEREAKTNNELDFEEAILQEVEKITTVDIPDVLVEDELNRMLVSMQKRVSDMGLLLEDYLKSQGKTIEQIRSEFRTQAEKNVRMELGLAEIARLEGVQITDQEVQAEVDKIPDARVKAQFEAQEPRLHLKHSLRQIRTLDFLKSLVKTF